MKFKTTPEQRAVWRELYHGALTQTVHGLCDDLDAAQARIAELEAKDARSQLTIGCWKGRTEKAERERDDKTLESALNRDRAERAEKALREIRAEANDTNLELYDASDVLDHVAMVAQVALAASRADACPDCDGDGSGHYDCRTCGGSGVAAKPRHP